MSMLSHFSIRPRPVKPAKTGSFTLSGVTIVNPGAGRKECAGVTITDGHISAIEMQAENPKGSSKPFLLPGLADMHMHLPPHNRLRLTPYIALLYLAHGVTSLREAGDLDGTAVNAALDGLRNDAFPCPRLLYCGPFIGAGKKTFKNTILLSGPEDAKAAVTHVKSLGASFAKFYEGLTLPMIRALENECRQSDIGIMGHVPSGLAYEEALIPEVQHFFGVPRPLTLERDTLINRSCDWQAVDGSRMDEIVDISLAHGIANTPTIVVNEKLLSYLDYEAAIGNAGVKLLPPFYSSVIWHPEQGRVNVTPRRNYLAARVPESVAKKKTLAEKLFRAGAKLYIGTDCTQPFVIPGQSVHEEMARFVDAGIPLEGVWRIATRDAGERLGVEGLGRIQVGAPADLLLFKQDPTASFANMKSLDAVISRGQLFWKTDLDRAVSAYRDFYRSPMISSLGRAGAKRAMSSALAR